MVEQKGFTSIIVENDAEFKKALDLMGEKISDFSIPFNLIANDFYRSNKIIFGLQSKGLYTDIQPTTKERHDKWNNAVYPILVGKTGRLASSLLSKNARDSYFFAGKKFMIFGTKTPYAIYHQSDEGRKRLSGTQLENRVFRMMGKNQKIRESMGDVKKMKSAFGRRLFKKMQKTYLTSFENDMVYLLPQRKMIFISGGPNEKALDSRITGRLERWTTIVKNHVANVTAENNK